MIDKLICESPYVNLVIEGRKDLVFIKKDIEFFKVRLALCSFGNSERRELLAGIVDGLKEMLEEAKEYQKYLERTEKNEYRAHILKLQRDLKDTNGKEEHARTTNNQHPKPKPKITWSPKREDDNDRSEDISR